MEFVLVSYLKGHEVDYICRLWKIQENQNEQLQQQPTQEEQTDRKELSILGILGIHIEPSNTQ